MYYKYYYGTHYTLYPMKIFIYRGGGATIMRPRPYYDLTLAQTMTDKGTKYTIWRDFIPCSHLWRYSSCRTLAASHTICEVS
jgi:hypothetical protein